MDVQLGLIQRAASPGSFESGAGAAGDGRSASSFPRSVRNKHLIARHQPNLLD
nr:hypothetical protein [Pseudonocardiales bacterium]